MAFRTNLFARLLILVVSATLPALAVLIYLQHDLRTERLSRIPGEALQKVELINSDLRSVMEGARQLSAAVARYHSVRTLAPGCARHMREVESDLPQYALVSVRDAQGRLVCSSNDETPPAPVAEHCLTRGAPPPLGTVRVGRYVPATAGRVAVLPLCVAFSDAGNSGFIVMELSLDWLAAHIGELPLPPRSTVGIADRDGTTLVRLPGQAEQVGTKLPAGVLPFVDTDRSGTAWVNGVDGQHRVVGFVPAGLPVETVEQGVFVSIGLFAPDIIADIDRAAWQGLVLIGVGAALSLVLASFAAERFVRRPTAALLDAAQRWSQGDLSARAPVGHIRGAEFGRLAAAFNNMAEALGRRRRELEELNTTLEARVQERTRDLEESRNRLQIEIAERERTEAELHQAHKLQAVGQLAGGIAHDFNNLLTAIVGALDLLRRRMPAGQEALGRLIDSALHAAERGGRLTGQLLAFSRRQQLLPVPTDFNVSVLTLTGLLGSTLGRNIRIETDLTPDLWPAMVDPTQVETMILNLAINARDAMPGGGVLTIRTRNVTLEAGRGDLGRGDQGRGDVGRGDVGRGDVGRGDVGLARPGDYVALEVDDSGVGIPEDVLERVFEPFFTTKRLGEGAGLGLSQVHGLAVQSGGDVRIESRPGQGTRVTVLLPRAHSRAARHAGAAQSADEGAGARLRVLVVDDDRAVREMASEMLTERGHDTVLAADAAEAVGLLRRAADGSIPPFDVMLADYVMPGMNGVALIEAAQVLCPRMHALLVTGNVEFEAAERMSAAEIMRKPFTIAQLEERVAALIARGRPSDMRGAA